MLAQALTWSLVLLSIGLLTAAAWLWRQSKRAVESQLADVYRSRLNSLAHDVSGPLQNILFILENLSSYSIKDEARLTQDLQLINAEIRRLMRLTERAKMLVRLEASDALLSRELIDMSQIVEEVILALDGVAKARQIKVTSRVPSRPPLVMGDRDQLKEVLVNLVENGIKYSRKEGGEVLIWIHPLPGHLQVQVVDTGIGIPEEALDSIWQIGGRVPNLQTRGQFGAGLGLPIVKEIIERHGGKITVRSKVDEGTSFTFTLPLPVMDAQGKR